MGTKGDCHLVWCVYQWGSSEVSNNNHNITGSVLEFQDTDVLLFVCRRVDSTKTVTVM